MDNFKLDILDPERFIKTNDVQEVTNPVYFVRKGVPTDDGLLSNTIFGITTEERANKYAYIDLTEWFLHPLIYKLWVRMDNRIREIVHGTKKFSINSAGDFIEDEENGSNGVKFLKDNIDKIKIKRSESHTRDTNIKFIMDNKDKIFIKKWIVIPAYYRDVNTEANHIEVGELNRLYNLLLIAVRSLKETADYGLSMSSAAKGRVQELLLDIYNWLSKEPNIYGKRGIIKRAVMSKTADYASRLVLSAPNLRVEKLEDLMVDLDHSAVPLASLCTNLYPYVVFWIRRFFENEFSGSAMYPYLSKDDGQIHYVKVKDPLIEFSDNRIKKELDRFIHGYSNRFIPIEVPNEENRKIYMVFKGRQLNAENATQEEILKTPLVGRRLTWCDLIYMACVECSADKSILITRYPMDSYFNQFPSKIVVASTKDTEPIWYDNKFYKHYPKIRKEDIGQDTSNKFIDTLNICNLYLGAIGGDYDGDQVTVKAAYSIEANKELQKHMDSTAHFISLGGVNVRTSSNEAIQAIYNMTLVLPETKCTDPVF